MHSMCAPSVTRQMSRRYSHSRQTLSNMSCATFPIAVLMRSLNSGSVFWKWWDVNIVLDWTSREETTHCQVWSYGVTKSSDNLYAHCTLEFIAKGQDRLGNVSFVSLTVHTCMLSSSNSHPIGYFNKRHRNNLNRLQKQMCFIEYKIQLQGATEIVK